MRQNNRCCCRFTEGATLGAQALHYRVAKYKMEIFRQLHIVRIGTNVVLRELSQLAASEPGKPQRDTAAIIGILYCPQNVL